MTYQIVFFDIDGTLINEQKQLPQHAIEAVSELKASGVEAVIATGRAPYLFQSFAEQLGIDSYVSLNGAYVVYKGELIFQREIPRSQVEQLVQHAAKHRHSLVFQGHATYVADEPSHPHIVESIASLQVDRHPEHIVDFWRTESIYQILLHCEARDEHLYRDVVPELRYIRWHEKAMDVLPSERSKAQGIQALLSHVGVDRRQTVAFGDGLNDKEMLAMAGLGIAMGNAHDELKPYADYLTTHVDEYGIRNGLRYAGLIK